MSATRSEPYINITGAGTLVSNAESTMFYVASHTTVKLMNIVMGGMSGFVPSGSDDKDMGFNLLLVVSTIKMDPNSAIRNHHTSELFCYRWSKQLVH